MFATTTCPTIIVGTVYFDQTGANGLPGRVKIGFPESHQLGMITEIAKFWKNFK